MVVNDGDRDLEERLDTARRRFAALFKELANPGSTSP
jgi:hypothetical protein